MRSLIGKRKPTTGISMCARNIGSLVLVAAWLTSFTCRAQGVPERAALVVGNGNYSDGTLPFAGNDASAMSMTLQKLGFAVTRAENLNTVDMNRTIEAFAQRSSGAKVVLFYFAGHGVQTSHSRNYLLPVDISPTANQSQIEGGVCAGESSVTLVPPRPTPVQQASREVRRPDARPRQPKKSKRSSTIV